jgi:hypothetical protein
MAARSTTHHVVVGHPVVPLVSMLPVLVDVLPHTGDRSVTPIARTVDE